MYESCPPGCRCRGKTWTDAVNEFRHVWSVETKAYAPLSEEAVDNLRKADWTVADLRRIAARARHARATDGGYLVILDRMRCDTSLTGVADHLLGLAWRLTVSKHRAMTVAEALGWAAVLTGTPADGAERLARLISPLAPRSMEQVVATWGAIPAGLAPLAWAAGLSPEEAAVRLRDGTLTEPRLRALAGLRGYRLPETGGAVSR